MSVNRHLPHILVLPEDDANRQIANGFLLGLDQMLIKKVQVLPVAGGWVSVLDNFNSNLTREMNRFPLSQVVLLIDFDNDHGNRMEKARNRIPIDLRERVYILGVSSTPESLKQAGLGNYELIGSLLAEDCRLGTNNTWGHELLQHNADELQRLRIMVCPVLFPIA